MPIYEFKCNVCGRTEERLLMKCNYNNDYCQLCHGTLKKVPSLSSFRLKGAGWAKDNYSKGGNNG